MILDGVDFLDRLSDRDRERLVAASTTVRVARGEFLMRQSERGGEVYRVVEGELEVIDGRQQPAVVLDVLGRGRMVGEMGFLEEQLRTADVRAADTTVLQRWDRVGLLKVLDADPAFAAAFYRAFAALAVDRSRRITTAAMVGALAAGKTSGSESALQEARILSGTVKRSLNEVELLIRRERDAAAQTLVTVLHNFQAMLDAKLAGMPRHDRAAAGELVGADLLPYMMRSHLGELTHDRADRAAGDIRTMAHIAAHRPEGDGPLGELIDAWLLDLPSARALRERRALAAQLVTESLPAVPPTRLLCIGANSASLLASELDAIGRQGGEIVVVDSKLEALALVREDFRNRPRSLKLKLMQGDLAALCAGRAFPQLIPPNVVVVDGLVEYLPERVVVTCVKAIIARMAPGARLVVTAMSPAPDEPIFQYLLKWPMTRRSGTTLRELLESAGLAEVRFYPAGSAGLVAVGQRPLV